MSKDPLIYKPEGAIGYSQEQLPLLLKEALIKPVMDHIAYSICRKKLGIYGRGLHPEEYTEITLAVLSCCDKYIPGACSFYSYAVMMGYYAMLNRHTQFYKLQEIEDEQEIIREDHVPIKEIDRPFRVSDFLENVSDENSPTYEMMVALLDTLTEREREIIILRYGIMDGYTYTLDEVGRRFNVTRERVRQLEIRALAKLNFNFRSSKEFFTHEEILNFSLQGRAIYLEPLADRKMYSVR